MDHIKNLLTQTGWSYEELLQKLNEFKNCPTIDAESTSSEPQHQSDNIQQNKNQQEIEDGSQCKADLSSSEVQHQSNNSEKNGSQQKIKEASRGNADLNSSKAQIQSINIEQDANKHNIEESSLSSADLNNSSALPHLFNDNKKNQSQQCKNCPPIDAESTSSESQRQSDNIEQNENQETIKDGSHCKADLNSPEVQHRLNNSEKNGSQQKIEEVSRGNTALNSSKSQIQSNKIERDENEQDIEEGSLISADLNNSSASPHLSNDNEKNQNQQFKNCASIAAESTSSEPQHQSDNIQLNKNQQKIEDGSQCKVDLNSPEVQHQSNNSEINGSQQRIEEVSRGNTDLNSSKSKIQSNKIERDENQQDIEEGSLISADLNNSSVLPHLFNGNERNQSQQFKNCPPIDAESTLSEPQHQLDNIQLNINQQEIVDGFQRKANLNSPEVHRSNNSEKNGSQQRIEEVSRGNTDLNSSMSQSQSNKIERDENQQDIEKSSPISAGVNNSSALPHLFNENEKNQSQQFKNCTPVDADSTSSEPQHQSDNILQNKNQQEIEDSSQCKVHLSSPELQYQSNDSENNRSQQEIEEVSRGNTDLNSSKSQIESNKIERDKNQQDVEEGSLISADLNNSSTSPHLFNDNEKNQSQQFKNCPPIDAESTSSEPQHQSDNIQQNKNQQEIEDGFQYKADLSSPEVQNQLNNSEKNGSQQKIEEVSRGNVDLNSSKSQSNKIERNENQQKIEEGSLSSADLNNSSASSHLFNDNEKNQSQQEIDETSQCNMDSSKTCPQSNNFEINGNQQVIEESFRHKVDFNSSEAQHQSSNIKEDKNQKKTESYSPYNTDSNSSVAHHNDHEEYKIQQESKRGFLCNADSSTSEIQFKNHEENESQQEFKTCLPCNADSNSSETHQFNNREVNKSQIEFKNCSPSYVNLNLSGIHRQLNNYEENQNQQTFKQCNAELNSSETDHKLNNRKESESQQDVKNCLPCNADSSTTDTPQQLNSDEESKSQQEVKADLSSSQTYHQLNNKSQIEFKNCSSYVNFSLSGAHHQLNIYEESKRQQDVKNCSSCNADSSTIDTLQPLNINEESKSQQEIKAELSSSQTHHQFNKSQIEFKNCSSSYVNLSLSGVHHQFKQCNANLSSSETYKLNNHKESESQQDLKKYDTDSSEAHQLNNYKESESQQDVKNCSSCNADSSTIDTPQPLNSDESKSQQEINADLSSSQTHHQSNNDESDDFKKCLPHNVAFSSSKTDFQLLNQEKVKFKTYLPCKSTSSSSEARNAKEFNMSIGKSSLSKVNNVKERHIPSETSQSEMCNCESKNNKVDVSDHNYIKKTNTKDCNNMDCERNIHVRKSITMQENRINESVCKKIKRVTVTKQMKRKTVAFRNRFLYRIKRSYRRRRRHKNVKRRKLIPRKPRRNKEGVRNQILLQLELLRNRRTSDFGKELHQTIKCDLAEPLFYKKRVSNEKLKNEMVGCSKASECIAAAGCSTAVEYNTIPGDSASLSIASTEIKQESVDDDNKNSYTIKPTKTKDITKIKGWKRKRFESLNDLSTTKNCNFVPVMSTPSCSYKDPSNQNQQNIPCDNQKTSESPISAFASNNLDGFLHESANLQISFQIPKLASGEDCINITPAPSAASVTNFTNTVVPQNEPDEEMQEESIESTIINGDTENLLKIHKITNIYKPRTVAQRRRIWRLRNDVKIMKQDESVRKPRTLAEKRRLMDDDSKNFIPVKRSARETNFFDENLNYSYVLYRGKKLRVPTSTKNGVIAYIKYSYNNKKDYIYVPKKRKMSPNKNKPSIFNTNSAVKNGAIKYRPGPLCKKMELQEENKSWRTVIKKLPKVYLEVTPKINRPIHPKLLHLLPDYQFEMTTERVEFALSVVWDKKQQCNINSTSFRFPVTYANHEESLLFREKIIANDVKPNIQQDSEMLITDVIKDVISKMLDYVETKDVADEIFIKEDVNIKCRDEEINMSSAATPNPKRKPKKSKTNYELKRLNVKVIEVDLEDKGDVLNCNKDYCKLGCICKSLATSSSLVSNHCGIPDCMFGCICNYDRKSRGNLKITLPVGIDVLSEGAVSRLEDEAKKNLAKVEKEFTQTVIQANNQTIVVGGHCNRQRRLTKAPRKYNDFIDDPDFLLQNEIESEVICEPLEEIQIQPHVEWKPCFVKMPKLKLEQLIPFCLVHNLHNCYCEYKAQFKMLPVTENKVNLDCYMKRVNDDYVSKSYSHTESQTCARTRGIATSYYVVRNRTQEFIETRKKKLDKLYKEYLEKLYKDDEVDIHAYSEVEVTRLKEKDENIDVVDKQVSRKTRRKQQLTVREDNVNLQTVKQPEPKKKFTFTRTKQKIKLKNCNLLKALTKGNDSESKQTSETDEQPLKIATENPSASELNNVVKDDTLPKFDNLFMSGRHTTELLTPSTAVRKKFLQLLGKKNECDAQFRLMPWNSLATKYETNKLQLWYSSFYKIPKIIMTDSVVVPKHFTNVKQFENVQDKKLIKVDLIRWLVTKTVPGGKKGDDVLVILQLTKTHCEVCGICEKTCISSQSSENMLLALIPSFVTQNNDTENNSTTENKDKEAVVPEPDNKILNFETIDEQKKQHVIARKIKFSKCKYPEVTLQEADYFDSTVVQDNTSKRMISANLPHINKNSRWRMIQLNSDFSILSLLRNSYAIKYSDLLRIVRMAQSTSTTIVLKTSEVDQNYPHPDFGIFAAPNCDEKIFIGPYFCNESHDISTLRYVNRVLVKTELFNQMKGKAPTNNGCWMKQIHGQQVEKKNMQTIDLTLGDSDNETEFIETQTQDTNLKYVPSSRSLLKQPGVCTNNGDKDREIPSNNNLSAANNTVVEATTTITVQEEPSTEKSIFTIDDVANFEMSAVDFEVADNSGDCVLEEDNAVNVRSFENQLYLVPNVPLMGYILAHKLRTIIIVRWPTLNNAKRFYRIEEAVIFVEKELSEYFIVPPNFKISIRVKTELTPGINDPFDPKYLKGYFIATKFGVKSLLNINAQTLKLLDVTSKELELLARRRAKKMIYDKCCDIAKQFVASETLKAKSCSEVIDMITSEIKTQKKAETFYIDKHQKLLSKKEKLVNNLSSVIKDISPYVSNKTQSAMLDILKRHKTPTQSDIKSSEKEDVVCITIDSDEETSPVVTEKTQPTILPPTLTEPPPLIIPKITVRNLHDLRDPVVSKSSDNSNITILTKKRKSEIPKALRVKNFGILVNHDNTQPIVALAGTDALALNTNMAFDPTFEKIRVLPVLKPLTCLSQNANSSTSVKENSVLLPTSKTEETVTVVTQPRNAKKKFRQIFPALSKCVIKTPAGKLIRVNADQFKNIQNKSIFLGSVTKESGPQDGGVTVITNPTAHTGFLKINLDDAVSTQLLRKASEASNVQPSNSS